MQCEVLYGEDVTLEDVVLQGSQRYTTFNPAFVVHPNATVPTIMPSPCGGNTFLWMADGEKQPDRWVGWELNQLHPIPAEGATIRISG